MNYHDENRTRGHWLSKPPLSMGCGVVLPILILAVVLGFIPLVRFYTDFVWYDALGYAAVFWKRFWPQWLLFGFVFILSLGIVRFSLMRARKTALEAVVFFDSPLNLPRVKMIINAFALVVALALAFGAKDQWAMGQAVLYRIRHFPLSLLGRSWGPLPGQSLLTSRRPRHEGIYSFLKTSVGL